jgi:hypothetical protein
VPLARFQTRGTLRDLVRMTTGGVSRTQLAHELGVSRAAVTGLVNDLLARQVLHEAGNRSSNGWGKSVIQDLHSLASRPLGIDIGASGAPGEIGKITFDPDGPLWTCGNRGRLQAAAGGAAFARCAVDASRRGTPSVLDAHAPLESPTTTDVREIPDRTPVAEPGQRETEAKHEN